MARPGPKHVCRKLRTLQYFRYRTPKITDASVVSTAVPNNVRTPHVPTRHPEETTARILLSRFSFGFRFSRARKGENVASGQKNQHHEGYGTGQKRSSARRDAFPFAYRPEGSISGNETDGSEIRTVAHGQKSVNRERTGKRHPIPRCGKCAFSQEKPSAPEVDFYRSLSRIIIVMPDEWLFLAFNDI